MKKVGIVTIISMNLGNRLQNYALQKTIERMGYDCFTIPAGNKTSYRMKIVIKSLLKPVVKKFANISWDRFDKEIKWDDIWKKNSFPSDYYKFVAGSDQIWNPLFDINSGREFLDFAESSQKVAYAASIGLDSLPENVKDQYRSYLNDFQAISMREFEGAQIVNELTGRETQVVLDPTMLMTAEEWKIVASKSSIKPKRKYIAKYILGIKNEQYDKYIDLKAKESGVDVFDIGEYNKLNHNAIGPFEFLYLISNSECFYTDSFHGTVFSILFHKDFVVFERPDEEGYGSMSSRLSTLLKMFSLEERRVKSESDLHKDHFSIDYQYVDMKLNEEKKKSVLYLKKALE